MTSRFVRCFAIAMVGLGLASCSAKLSEDVRIPETRSYVIVKQKKVTGANSAVCEQKPVLEFKSLPVGDGYELNVDRTFAWFSANEFGVEFFDSGQLKSVTLNSDPQVDETIASTATLVKEVAGAVATVAPAMAALAEAPKGDCAPEHQRVSEEVQCVVPLSCFEKLGRCPSNADECAAKSLSKPAGT